MIAPAKAAAVVIPSKVGIQKSLVPGSRRDDVEGGFRDMLRLRSRLRSKCG
jgi:hypothetical protein